MQWEGISFGGSSESSDRALIDPRLKSLESLKINNIKSSLFPIC